MTPERVQNKTGDAHCQHCLDDGLVVVLLRQAADSPVISGPNRGETRAGEGFYDEMGPCPYCEKGFRIEFGIGINDKGVEYHNPRPPWGQQGYWRGRQPVYEAGT